MLTESQLEVLNTEFYHKSWANPFSGFNRGYRLEPSKSRAARRGARIYDIPVKFPNAMDTSIFLMPTKSVTWIGDTTILRNWMSVSDYCSKTGTLFTIINPVTALPLDITMCYIALINNTFPVLLTPFVGGSVDVNIDVSKVPYNFSATEFVRTGEVNERNDGINSALFNTSIVYMNNRYYPTNKLSDLPAKGRGVIINNSGFVYVASIDISGLDTYGAGADTFYVIDLGTEDDVIYHFTNMEFHLYNGTTNVGTVIDKTSTVPNIHQISNKMIAVKASYISNLCRMVGIPLELAMLKLHIMKSSRKYLGNAGYNKVIEQVEIMSPSKLVTNSDHRLNFVYADTLAKGLNTKLQMTNIPNSYLSAANYEPWTIDNRLMTKRSDVVDTRLSKIMVSGREMNKYKGDIKYTDDRVDLTDYVFPIVYTYKNTPAVFGTDYYVSTEGVLTLLNSAYVIDHNGRMEIHSTTPGKLINISDIPIYSHPKITLEVIADDIMLHRGIDYTVVKGSVIVWKEGVTAFTIALYFTNYKKTTVSWVDDERVVIPKANLFGQAERISVYLGNEQPEIENLIPAKNGLPYTIEYELLDLYNKDTDLDDIKRLRDEYDTNIKTLTDYYTRVEKNVPLTGFTDYYYLVSPLCVDVLAAMRDGSIDPTAENLAEKGVEGCLPDEIRSNYRAGYDPSTSSNGNGAHFVTIKAHDEPGMVEISPDEWNFLRQVSSILLGGRVTLELYYRIIYE